MTISYEGDYMYARDKLIDSLVMHDGKPVYIRHINVSDGEVEYLFNNKEGFCQVEDLDLTPVPLGFVNLRDECLYVSRRPARHWKQGLRDITINCVGHKVGIFSTDLHNTIMNIYPSINLCEEYIINKEKHSCAFSRKYCLEMGEEVINILRINTPVGEFSNGNIFLYENYEFLREELEEILNEN